MSFPSFGEIIEEAEVPSFKEFGDVVPEVQSGVKSRTHSLLRGLTKGATRINPLQPGGPVSPKLAERILQRILPSKEGVAERFSEKAGEILPSAISAGPEALLSALLSGATEQSLAEIGAPESIQNLASLLSLASPSLRGKIQPKTSQKEAVEFLRQKGLSEKAITPLIQTEQRIRKLGKYAQKGEKITSRIEEAKEKLGENYSFLKNIGEQKDLPKQHVTQFSNDLTKTLDKLTPDFKKLVEKNVDDLLSKPINERTIIDFWQDINNKMRGASRQGVTGGREVLGILKEPISKVYKLIDPKDAREFELTNKFYAKNSKNFATLKPKEYDNLIDLAETGALGGALLTGNLNLFQKVLGAVGGRALATELITNPRLQNIRKQMFNAAKKNRPLIFRKLGDVFVKEVAKKNPELSREIQKSISEENKQ